MTALHEPGEAWHIGWDWHADMWYVEPPFDAELPDGEPMKWFNHRNEAFEFVDEQIREQPVMASVVDEIPPNPVEATVIRHEDNPHLPRYVPKIERMPEPAPEPVRVLSEAAADRVADYASKVGLG